MHKAWELAGVSFFLSFCFCLCLCHICFHLYLYLCLWSCFSENQPLGRTCVILSKYLNIRFRRHTSHDLNWMLMRENKGFFSFAFNSAHVKYGIWTWPKSPKTCYWFQHHFCKNQEFRNQMLDWIFFVWVKFGSIAECNCTLFKEWVQLKFSLIGSHWLFWVSETSYIQLLSLPPGFHNFENRKKRLT